MSAELDKIMKQWQFGEYLDLDEDEAKVLRKILAKAIRYPKPPRGSDASYDDCVVSFVDLLGFGNALDSWPASTIADVMHYFYETSDDYSYENNVQTVNFSDSIVRIRRITSDPRYSNSSPVVREISALSSIQFDLVCWYGLFLRGGTTFGPIYCNDGMTFGPALVQAYRLESKTAVYPRIIVDPLVIKALGDDRGAKSMKYYLLKDRNDNFFIDYLGANIKGASLDFLLNHKKAIVAQYASSTDDKVKLKYVWLKDYHNFSVASGRGFAEIGVTKDNILDFSISDDEIPPRNSVETFRFVDLFL